eukprot:scaffold5013_cov273-Pinguiococcus_pyrenoidosus.AAC.6
MSRSPNDVQGPVALWPPSSCTDQCARAGARLYWSWRRRVKVCTRRRREELENAEPDRSQSFHCITTEAAYLRHQLYGGQTTSKKSKKHVYKQRKRTGKPWASMEAADLAGIDQARAI